MGCRARATLILERSAKDICRRDKRQNEAAGHADDLGDTHKITRFFQVAPPLVPFYEPWMRHSDRPRHREALHPLASVRSR